MKSFLSLLFCLFSGTVLYLYNRFIVNEGLTLATYWRFLSVTVLCMIPVFFSPDALFKTEIRRTDYSASKEFISINWRKQERNPKTGKRRIIIYQGRRKLY
jgi:hypothetical protein